MILSGKTAIITGATGNLGKAIATLYAKEGANVVLVGRNEKKGKETESEIRSLGGVAIFVKADVTIPTDVQKMVERTIESFGKLDVLVNNVGGVKTATIIDIPVEDFDFVYNANVRSTFLCTKYSAPHIIQSGGGVILNVGSIGGHVALGLRAAYCSAKAALVMFTKVMAIEFMNKNIRVNCVSLGPLKSRTSSSGILDTLPNPQLAKRAMMGGLTPRRAIDSSDVAQLFLFLASDSGKYMTGSTIVMDDGITAGADYASYEEDLKTIVPLVKKAREDKE